MILVGDGEISTFFVVGMGGCCITLSLSLLSLRVTGSHLDMCTLSFSTFSLFFFSKKRDWIF